MKKTSYKKNELWPVNYSEHNKIRYMHFGTPWVQGSMRLDKPFQLDLDYAQRMMVWLLFHQPQNVPQLQAMQLGLGAAAITKFCFKYLRIPTVAVELNPYVIEACRNWFKLPLDNEQLQVIHNDAYQEILNPHWLARVDALQVDLYDAEAAAPIIDSQEFYQACRQILTDSGIMTVNLFGRYASFTASWQKIQAVFGVSCCSCFFPTKDGNTIVIASKTPLNWQDEKLLQRAEYIKQHWHLAATKWLNLINHNI